MNIKVSYTKLAESILQNTTWLMLELGVFSCGSGNTRRNIYKLEII